MSTKLAYVVFFATIATAFNITTLRTSTPLRPTPECNTTINFIVHDMDTYNSSVSPERTAQTSCSAAWPALNGTPPTKWQSCVDTNFSWMFSDGESDIQGFKNVGDFGFSVSHGWEEPGQGYLEEFGWTVANSSSLTCGDSLGRHMCHLRGGKELLMPVYEETL